MNTTKMFFGGVPVAPDVKKLLDHFGIPTPGFIAHEEVEPVLGVGRNQSRYRTVTRAWCDALWDKHNVRQIGCPGGFKTLMPEERLDYGEYQRTKGVRRFEQAVKEVVTTPVSELDDQQKRRHTNLLSTTFKALSAAKEAQKEYGRALASGNFERLPQRPMPKKGDKEDDDGS